MKNIFLLLLIALTTLTSCRNNSDKTSSQNQEQEIKEINSLSISINYRTNKSDVFKIMMNNIIVDEFQKKSIQFSEEVVPTTNFDNIEVIFDAGNLSKNIIFQLGNKVEKTVEIKDITISYGDKVFTLSNASDFNDFIIFNKFTDINLNTKVITTKRVDGKLHPSFSLRQKLINQLK